MQAYNSDIQNFLGTPQTIFVVPVYQRNYDWKDEHCKQLFRDILNVIQTGNDHFLGTICFKMYGGKERLIIDGQQRLTSITLLLKALYDREIDEDIKSAIMRTYLCNDLFRRQDNSTFWKYKLHLNKRDDEVFRMIMECESNELEYKLTPAQKTSRVFKNYLLFLDLLGKSLDKDYSGYDFYDALGKLSVIELCIQNENPQQIFESMNSTGLDLTNVDLLRNYMLMQFNHETQTKLYDDYWSKIEDAIGVDTMEQFFADFLVYKRRSDAITINGRKMHVNERNLYVSFKDYYATFSNESVYDKTFQLFNELKECALIYKSFVFEGDYNLYNQPQINQKIYFLLSINENTKARSLLLFLFALKENKKITDSVLEEAIDAITSLTFRARICKAYGVNRQFAGSVMAKLDTIDNYDDFMPAFWLAMTSGKGSYAFPSDAEFYDALTTRDLYQALHSNGMKYMLYTLEMNSSYKKGLPPYNDNTITIEHIMPRTLNTNWKIYLTKETMEKFDDLLGTIGNLALTNYNGEMSNKPFEEKKEIYKNTNFYYTRNIIEYENWQADDIEKRSHELADEALKIWRLPEGYQHTRAVSKSWHTIDEDPGKFAYTKPEKLLIGNDEFEVDHWSDIIPLICMALYEESPDALTGSVAASHIASIGVEDGTQGYDENKAFIKINPTQNIYVRHFMSTSDVLNTATRMLANFDQITGTDYLGNILFSLRLRRFVYKQQFLPLN